MSPPLNRRELLRFATAVGGAGSLASWSGGDLHGETLYPHTVDVARTRGGAVSCNSAIASSIGMTVIKEGGNAVDAAVATALAMAVTWPEAGNIGGGGFMMVSPVNEAPVCIDYRETAPAIVTPTSLAQQRDRRHPKMVGVPGTVRGLGLAHARFGKLTWDRLVQPAIQLANHGCVVDGWLARTLNGVLASIQKSGNERHQPLTNTFAHPAGRPWQIGDVLRQPVLGKTLERIAAEGSDEFYTGETSRHLAAYFSKVGGWITAADLKTYRAVERASIQTAYAGHEIYGPPPPSSGGITVQLVLRMLEHIGLTGGVDSPSGQADWNRDDVHRIAETMRRAFRERAAYLGDPDFVSIPDFLSTTAYAEELADSISLDRATDSRDIAGSLVLSDGPPESPQTTHFSVVDRDGMAVSNTYTLEASWGSWLLDPATGFVFNNEMGDFNWVPGYTNDRGQIGSKANQMAPGKRMLSSQTPTIVRRDGANVLVTGSPGGRTIINTVICILVQSLNYNRSLPDAIAASRFHHQWLPDALRLEIGSGESLAELKDSLADYGHKVTTTSVQGAAHSIAIEPATGVRVGVADWRRGGRVAI
ncbi:Gamma-glutamyltranspeptidase precursor [Roseimaritima multifibrata]|uniref:Glutathione hydrolase proenzyme n=1 Tax=Roseimaritima multifibrata TaxID=1930274 RepID=A0A517ME60_9BACT|nr:gamma-glutamyltransferase [Roseimaritima multifibrata]QDS93171.1 Gamma-glutamyltranspeptidase precursor [Roseimaritima multifibrata]